ncbi:GNAT family N-acetyltransferase [Pseudomonas fluorescens]|uniref:GNAT family N-acetyltransferase n=1 Tax=Pseudomonas fluorescens TaxID=294 RepID=UPI000FF48E73|nr:GNAT family N-acetyltransferase [Pseudomonas fluorescens]RON88403.1 hypothetical protein BK668_15685 [Pseudomonas fluorescens]
MQDWQVATDYLKAHEWLCASDRYHATAVSPAPQRNPETTRRHVLAGVVHELYQGGALVGTFTLTDAAPHGMDPQVFGEERPAVYLQRLVVAPDALEQGALVGLRCVTRACELARSRRAEVIRAEVNPALQHVYKLLLALGFKQVGTILHDAEHRQRVNMQRVLV